jgi:UDP-N-acetylmuramate dehydrogenase
MPLPALSGVALSHGLSGLEFGVAIPASFGGAVLMNAGAHGRELADLLESIDVFVLDQGVAQTLPVEDAEFAYRRSGLPSGSVVTGAAMLLRAGDPSEIRRRIEEAREWRRRTQPLAEPNCGSVFKNPPGDHAARLIDAAGGKDLSVGGAAVSAKHANFIVASEGTSASDVATLIRSVQERVASRFGVRLEPEVHLIGDFDLAAR